jgi:hypothetical protein
VAIATLMTVLMRRIINRPLRLPRSSTESARGNLPLVKIQIRPLGIETGQRQPGGAVLIRTAVLTDQGACLEPMLAGQLSDGLPDAIRPPASDE